MVSRSAACKTMLSSTLIVVVVLAMMPGAFADFVFDVSVELAVGRNVSGPIVNGAASLAQFNQPTGVTPTWHTAGPVLVCDWLNFAVRSMDPKTGDTTTLVTQAQAGNGSWPFGQQPWTIVLGDESSKQAFLLTSSYAVGNPISYVLRLNVETGQVEPLTMFNHGINGLARWRNESSSKWNLLLCSRTTDEITSVDEQTGLATGWTMSRQSWTRSSNLRGMDVSRETGLLAVTDFVQDKVWFIDVTHTAVLHEISVPSPQDVSFTSDSRWLVVVSWMQNWWAVKPKGLHFISTSSWNVTALSNSSRGIVPSSVGVTVLDSSSGTIAATTAGQVKIMQVPSIACNSDCDGAPQEHDHGDHNPSSHSGAIIGGILGGLVVFGAGLFWWQSARWKKQALQAQSGYHQPLNRA